MYEMVTGDDEKIPITLKKNGATFAISDSAIVKAALIDKNRSMILAGPVTVSRLEAGANWANSLLIIVFQGKLTSPIKSGQPALIEIEVNDGGKKTWFADVKIIKGLI